MNQNEITGEMFVKAVDKRILGNIERARKLGYAPANRLVLEMVEAKLKRMSFQDLMEEDRLWSQIVDVLVGMQRNRVLIVEAGRPCKLPELAKTMRDGDSAKHAKTDIPVPLNAAQYNKADFQAQLENLFGENRPTDWRRQVGQLVLAAREKGDIGLRELSYMVKMNPKTLSHLESGNQPALNPHEIVKLREFLEASDEVAETLREMRRTSPKEPSFDSEGFDGRNS